MPTKKTRLQIINSGLGTHYGSIGEAWHALELPWVFAGLRQYRANMAGKSLPPWLRDVNMTNPVSDKRVRTQIVNRIASHTLSVNKAHLDEWKRLVPKWAGEVRDDLDEYDAGDGVNVPFSVELLASPEIDLNEKGPLFEADESPQSLNPFGVQQAGERDFLQQLNAPTLVRELWPLQYRYNHRPEGSKVPPDLVGGLTFGNPASVYDYEPGPYRDAVARYADAMGYVKSAVLKTDAYKAYQAEQE